MNDMPVLSISLDGRGYPSPEEVVDVFLRYLAEGGPDLPGEGLLLGLRLGGDLDEDVVERLRRPLDPEAYQPQRRAAVEDDHQDDPVPDQGDVDVVLLSLVEQDGEFLLS